MKKIHSYLNSLKDKKNSQTSASAVNSAQINTVTADNNISDLIYKKNSQTSASAVNSAQINTVTADNNISDLILRIKKFKKKKKKKKKKNKNNSESKIQLAITDDFKIFQMINLTEIINISLIFVSYNSFINYRLIDSFNEHLYISKDVIFQKNFHLTDLSASFIQDLKTQLTAVYQTATVISSVISDLNFSIDNLFVEENIQLNYSLFLVLINN
ncbi:hypothetical protein EMPG_11055 [Blastomyces silverae]|uniref:Uncharacterized protein n=1 Tax=Blastomyces silverae TaxID=2060906 RepID=A0A0H1B8A3_9EURO|nr:hypothetical protein EMPG_11055 [Blastomyces silverae]